MNRKQIDKVQKYLEDEMMLKQPREAVLVKNLIIIVALGLFIAWLAVMASTS